MSDRVKAVEIVKRLRAVQPARVNLDEEAQSQARTSTSSGRGQAVPSNAFTRAESAQATVEPEPKLDARSEKWIYALIERGARPTEVLARAEERLRRAPTRTNFLAVQALLNEFARDTRSRVPVRDFLAQQRVKRFLSEE